MNAFLRYLAIVTCGLSVSGLASAQSSPPESTGSAPVVLITGSNRGIGLALSAAYAKAGWYVVATCRDPERATELAALAKLHRKVTLETLDVTSSASIDALVAKYRGKPIDVLVNNAGTSGNYEGQLPGKFDQTAFDEIMSVNAFAPLRISSALLANVSASRQKKIIAITSGRGSVSKPFLDHRAYFYDMSKAALNLGMRKLQDDVRDREVLVGIFAPGVVETDLNHNLRNGVPPRLALISAQESAAALITMIENLTAANQDRFLNYNGQTFTW